MKKALTLIVFLSLLFSGTALFAQVSAELHGVSPRETLEDSLDIFDVAFNANANTGTETKMYLKGSPAAGTWNIILQPDGSTATIGDIEVGEGSEVAVFMTDLTGTYKVEYTDGSTADTLTINAGKYVGIDGGNCAMCHNDKAADWEGTGHSDMLVRGLDGTLSSHYASYCISCHVVGYDTAADNDGFDDFDFVFPDSLYMGVYDQTVALYPDAMARANIQCESCHGPGSEHSGNVADNRITSDLNMYNCAWCHDSGSHHYYPDQVKKTGHFSPPGYPGGGRTSCRGCHNGAQFIQYVSGEEVTPQSSDDNPIVCAVCHDPHSAENGHMQVRTLEATLSNGEEVTVGGTGVLCMNCHQSRREANSYTEEPHGHYGPHYVPQADMILGTNAVTFGYDLPSSPHAQAAENSCASCHMYNEHHNVGVGEHTFSVVNAEGVENVEICAPCHGEVEEFGAKKYYKDGNADHDGDGVEEGLHDEVSGLMEELAYLLPSSDTTDYYDPHDDVDDSFTKAELKAAFNYEMVYYDHSYGIHNPAFTVALLKVSIEALKYGAITSGEMVSVSDIPMDQGYQVRVVWTKFGADDGVSMDQVKEYSVLRQVTDMAARGVPSYGSISEMPADLAEGSNFILDGHLWDVVANVPATQFGEYAAVVPTLYNSVEGDTSWASFKVLGKTEGGIVAETEPMDGYSTDDLAPAAPTGLVADLDGSAVTLTWDEAYDKDVETFDVYRSVDQDFDLGTAEYLGSTRSLTFIDASLTGQSINYSVVAVDFSENESENAAPVNVIITGVADNAGAPTEFELAQNYPNPFNPSTQIKFGLPDNSNVKLTIYNAVGKEVATLVNEQLTAGYHVFTWNAANNASGVYFYQIQTDNIAQVKKMILVK